MKFCCSEKNWEMFGKTVEKLDPFYNPCFFDGPCYVLHVKGKNEENKCMAVLEVEAKNLGIKNSIFIKHSPDSSKKDFYEIKVFRN